MQTYRDLLDDLVRKINDQAVDAGTHFRLLVRRWEGAAPRRTAGDGNREFRFDAANSHLVVVLLHGDLRDGTHEELREAMGEDDVQVAVIWVEPPDRASRKRAVRWLHKKMDEFGTDLRWEKAYTSLDAVGAIVGVLTRVVIDLADQEKHPQREVYSESR